MSRAWTDRAERGHPLPRASCSATSSAPTAATRCSSASNTFAQLGRSLPRHRRRGRRRSRARRAEPGRHAGLRPRLHAVLHARQPRRGSTGRRAAAPSDEVADALERLAAEGVGTEQAAALLDRALIVPVLTAHPTEVMRKSMIDHRNRIAELMRLRDLGRAETREGDVIEAGDPAADRAAVADPAAAARTALCRRRSGNRAGLPARHAPPGAARAVRPLGAPAGRIVPGASCASAAGLAATVTATPTSPRTRCVSR